MNGRNNRAVRAFYFLCIGGVRVAVEYDVYKVIAVIFKCSKFLVVIIVVVNVERYYFRAVVFKFDGDFLNSVGYIVLTEVIV